MYSYSLFGQEVGVHFNALGQADEFMLKSDIFYILVGLILTNNVLLLSVGRALLKLPSNVLPIPNQTLWAEHREELNEHIRNWIYSLVAMINTSIALTIFALATVNNEFKFKIGDFNGLLYLIVGFLLAIIVALPIRLMMKPSSND
ncbi:MAG TPA: hypothetical protein DCR35_03550 [Runella sp.]|nr:hypothetical protein [Runella sp.]